MTDMYAADRRLAEQHAELLAEKLSNRSEVLIFDENLQEMGFVNDYLSLKFDASIDGSGALNAIAPQHTALASELVPRDPDRPLLMIAQTASYRWSGSVRSTVPRRDAGAAPVIDIEGDPILKRLDFVPLYKEPSRTLEQQPAVAPVASGNAITVVKGLAAANIARIQGAASWPIHVVPNYLSVDNSPKVAIASDMQPMGKAFLEALDGTGVALMMWIWMPGDQLVPGGESFDRPTMVLDVVDKGSFSGWSSDTEDPIQQYYRVLSGGGYVAQWLPRSVPIESPAYENGYPGSDNVDPWVDWDLDGPGIESYALPTVYAQCPTAVWTGLRRGWLAEIMSSIAADRNNPPATATPVLYDSVTDDERKASMGVLGAAEVVVSGTEAEDLASALFEYGGYRYLTVSVINGAPFVFGYHFGLGDTPSFNSQLWGRFFDVVTQVSYEDSPTVRCRWALTVGNGSADDPPSIKLLRRLRRNAELQQRYYTDVKAVITE